MLAWAGDEEAALADADAQFRFAAGGWKVQSELPNPVNFDAATATIGPAGLAGLIPAGPDTDRHAAAVREFGDAGFEHIAVAYPGADADGFMELWGERLEPAVR